MTLKKPSRGFNPGAVPLSKAFISFDSTSSPPQIAIEKTSLRQGILEIV